MSGLTNLPFDIVILLLRLAFVFLLYFFVFQVVRTLTRDLRGVKPVEAPASLYGRLIVVNPGSNGGTDTSATDSSSATATVDFAALLAAVDGGVGAAVAHARRG